MISIEWRGQSVSAREPTAGAYWRWLMALRDATADDNYVGVITWLSDHVDPACIVPATIEKIEDHPIRLGELILSSCEIGVRAMELTHRIADIDRSKVRFACECLRCSRKATYDEACIYVAAGIDAIEERVSKVSAELLSQMWERPYSLYRLAETARHCEELREKPRLDKVGTKGRSAKDQLNAFKSRLKGGKR
jgi:hypothetical protein